MSTPKETIYITVNGKEYSTYIDAHGTQRFPDNPSDPYVSKLCTLPGPNGMIINPEGSLADLNALSMMYIRGDIPAEYYMHANMAIGYSVCGFMEVMTSVGIRIEVKNPIWGEELQNNFDAIMELNKLTLRELFHDKQIPHHDQVMYSAISEE